MKLQKILLYILAVGIILTVLGGCIFLAAMIGSDWNFASLSNTVIEEQTYTEPEERDIRTVFLSFEDADIDIRFDENCDTLSIVYPQLSDSNGSPKNELHLNEEGDRIEIYEKRLWYKNIISLWDFSDPQVTVTLPADRDYQLVVTTANGAITVTGTAPCANSIDLFTDNGKISTEAATLSCTGDLSCNTANGKITLGAFEAENLFVNTNNGMIMLESGTADKKLYLSSDNGKIIVNGAVTAGEFRAETDNGELMFRDEISCESFTAETNNGNIFASSAITAQSIMLESDNGNINATVSGKRGDYTVTVEHDLGNTNLISQPGGTKTLTVETNIGDIDVTFTEE